MRGITNECWVFSRFTSNKYTYAFHHIDKATRCLLVKHVQAPWTNKIIFPKLYNNNERSALCSHLFPWNFYFILQSTSPARINLPPPSNNPGHR